MIIRRIPILLFVFLFSSFSLIHLTDTSQNRPSKTKISQILNLDSLRILISKTGWTPSFIDLYQYALINFQLDLKKEAEKFDELPGSFEKLYLQAVILKRT